MSVVSVAYALAHNNIQRDTPGQYVVDTRPPFWPDAFPFGTIGTVVSVSQLYAIAYNLIQAYRNTPEQYVADVTPHILLQGLDLCSSRMRGRERMQEDDHGERGRHNLTGRAPHVRHRVARVAGPARARKNTRAGIAAS